MSRLPSHLELALASIRGFADEDALDTEAWNDLIGIAKADVQIDDEERRVSANVLATMSRDDGSLRIWPRIAGVRAEPGI